LKNATTDELLHVDEIGEKIAESIISFFSNKLNVELFSALKNKGIQFEMIQGAGQVSDKLKGRSFIVSGVFRKYSRDQIKKMIEENGGRI